MTNTKSFLLRIPEDLALELEQAKWQEHLDKTEIVLQALAIRLRVVPRDRLPVLLERAGYQREHQPGRPPRAAAAANGSAPAQPGPEGPAGDWDLDVKVP